MGLRCSLLGHDFGDVVVEREREERGEDVVVTERELRECRRCGTESIISENTEVRRRRPGDERATARGDTDTAGTPDDPGSLVEEAEDSEAARERANEDAIILDDSTDETETTPATDQPADAAVASEDATVEGDDSAIDQDADPAATAEGETEPAVEGASATETQEESPDDRATETAESRPDASSAEASHGEPASDAAQTDESSSDAAQPDEPAPDTAGTDEPATAVDRTGEPWPNHPEPADENAKAVPESGPAGESPESAESTPESDFEFADSASGTSDPETPTRDPTSGIAREGSIDVTGPPDGNLDGMLECPACGYAVPVATSSNRAGDICPECHAGYLAEK